MARNAGIRRQARGRKRGAELNIAVSPYAAGAGRPPAALCCDGKAVWGRRTKAIEQGLSVLPPRSTKHRRDGSRSTGMGWKPKCLGSIGVGTQLTPALAPA